MSNPAPPLCPRCTHPLEWGVLGDRLVCTACGPSFNARYSFRVDAEAEGDAYAGTGTGVAR